MDNILNNIRKPNRITLSKNITNTTLIFIGGVILGIISNMLDETSSNLLPYIIDTYRYIKLFVSDWRLAFQCHANLYI